MTERRRSNYTDRNTIYLNFASLHPRVREVSPGLVVMLLHDFHRPLRGLVRVQTNEVVECRLVLEQTNDDVACGECLISAKPFAIRELKFSQTRLRIQSLVTFCRDNSSLKCLHMLRTSVSSGVESTVAVPPREAVPGNSSSILALDELIVEQVHLENTTVVTEFLYFLASATFQALTLGKITVGSDGDNDENTKLALLRILSALLKPSVQELTVDPDCLSEAMEVIEACTTVLQIHCHGGTAEAQQKVQTIATRNRALARFSANPHVFPTAYVLELLSQCDRCPTERYLLARHLPAVISFEELQTRDSVATNPKKRKREYMDSFS